METPRDYEAFLTSKLAMPQHAGLPVVRMPERLFPFQRRCTSWAVERGRAALFLDTGLGKTAQQLVWADNVASQAGKVLILAPLAVAQQTVNEGALMGIDVTLCRSNADVRQGINIANYERLHHFQPQNFSGIVLDESSILKSFDGKTRTQLIEAFRHTPHRLCASATPSPNDLVELGNHSEFLGILSRSEMLATFYIHDGGNTSQWRLKGHAEEHYWQWVASWAIALTHPREIGDETAGYDLPPLERHEHIIRVDPVQNGLTLFPMEAYSLTEQRAAKKASLSGRIQKTLELVHSLPAHEPCIIWCELNTEQETLATALGERAYSIYGSLSIEDKEKRLLAWLRQDRPILLTKPSIAGFGINMQHCAQMIFVGINNSFEAWYQAVRRCWRFGQQRTVHVHMILADIEMAILRNLRRKEEEAQRMQRGMTGAILQHMQWAITQQTYAPTQPMQIPAWLVSDTTTYTHEESTVCQPS